MAWRKGLVISLLTLLWRKTLRPISWLVELFCKFRTNEEILAKLHPGLLNFLTLILKLKMDKWVTFKSSKNFLTSKQWPFSFFRLYTWYEVETLTSKYHWQKKLGGYTILHFCWCQQKLILLSKMIESHIIKWMTSFATIIHQVIFSALVQKWSRKCMYKRESLRKGW